MQWPLFRHDEDERRGESLLVGLVEANHQESLIVRGDAVERVGCGAAVSVGFRSRLSQIGFPVENVELTRVLIKAVAFLAAHFVGDA